MAKTEGKEHPKVFISYSHMDEAWMQRVVKHFEVLEKQDMLCAWDDTKIHGGDDWLEEIEDALDCVSVAILLISADFLTSDFILEKEVPYLLERRQKEGLRVIPLIVKPCAWKQIGWLKQIQARPKDGKPLSGGAEHQINTDLADLVAEVLQLVNRAGKPETHVKGGVIPPDKVFTAKLPVTGRELFGREEQLKILDDAWGDEKTKIISFVAWGGVGKTALVNEWLNRMGEKNWQGAQRVYGWSFYSQGTTEDRQASSDTFLANALEWFGDKETAESNKSAWDKGVRLAELVREQKTLLILDGVEPLQYPPGPMKGRLKDQGLQVLLRELSHGMNGLCVITTRERIEDIEGQVGHSVKLVELENLSSEEGIELLKYLGVKTGSEKDFKDAVKEVKGHALALNLLGTFIETVHDGDIRKRDKIEKLAIEEEEKGGHAKQVMKSYEIWLKGTAELDILYLMGLFDRPAEKRAIDALRAKPIIKGLTDNLAGLSEEKWKYAVKHLRELHLLAQEEKDRPDDLDCHPLVREHFGEKLKKNKPDAWKEGHKRLYEYYKGVPKKKQPDTLEEMEPLFRAVYHGCAAGKHQETLNEVYYPRIQQGGETNYCCMMLGAFGSDLGAVACFFEKVWDRPAAGLSERDKAIVLSWAGFRLRAVGRLRESAEPFEASLELLIEQSEWTQAAKQAGNLSELYLTLGEVKKAVEYGRRSVEYAEKSRDEWRIVPRTSLADALHQLGEVEQAKRLFKEAEEMQRNDQPEFRYLYSLRGCLYCDLLILLGEYEEVKKRARQTLEWGKGQASLLDIALDKLSLGRAWLEELRIKKLEGRNRENCLAEAKRWLDEAVDGLRKAGTQEFMARGLLARAELLEFRIKNLEGKDREECLAEIWRDLDEAREIAERGEMKLWLADYHLESSRVCLDEGAGSPVADQVSNHSGTGKAKEHYEEAKRLIEECGYHRRDKELEELAGKLELRS
jgi:tetratricopeptide (TPR) repeat protein